MNKADSVSDERAPLITIGVLAYNHEKYIEECLRGIVKQQGDFRCNIIVLDDCSTDNTGSTVKRFIKRVEIGERMQIKYIRNNTNLGVVGNYAKLIKLIRESGCDYFCVCDGDDYYFTDDRLAKHLELHRQNSELSFSFNKLLLYFQDDDKYEIFEPNYIIDRMKTKDLVLNNRPGSLCASFYNARFLKDVPDDLFEGMFTGDWMFNIYYSQFGEVGQIRAPMSVYRKHSEGVWSGNNRNKNVRLLVKNIPNYNKYLDYKYNKYFEVAYNEFVTYLIRQDEIKPYNLIMIDNIFPNPLSGFLYQEFTNILSAIPNSVVYCSGAYTRSLSDEPIEESIENYKRSHHRLADKVLKLRDDSCLEGKMLYGIFLNTAYHNLLEVANRFNIPFAFTLYPGGGFLLDNEKSDQMLRAVMSSPWFRKVIVTQKVTYDYLTSKKFCDKTKIEFIFGVVTDDAKTNGKHKKQNYGLNKKTLDICFVAHKYTEHGEDKGYDLFIDVVRKISKKYNNVRFHVVGPWDEKVLDVSDIKNIVFYGSQTPGWLEKFYEDKDIIISANVDGILQKGAFDGFPTTSVTDAALCGVAMFVTDPLGCNDDRFEDGKEIVIIKHSVDDVLKKIEYYYRNPEELKNVGEAGKRKSEQIYSYENQMKPRLKVLTEILETESEHKSNNNNITISRKEMVKKSIYRVTPNVVKRVYRKIKLIKRVL